MQDVENVFQDAYYRTNCLNGLFVHDISNLFQIISNTIELCSTILKDEGKTEDISDYFRMIVQQLNRGKKLIRNIRNLSELEEYEMPLEIVEVFSTLRNAIKFTQISFPNKTIEIVINSDYRSLYTMANELLTEVFENIIVNAIKYNKNKIAQIEVIVSKIEIQQDNFVKFEFKDNGIGIDDARKEIIFQETRTKRGHSKGMGIGLSLVAKLIELYGGEIWVENRIKNYSTRGSNFIILVPLAKKEE